MTNIINLANFKKPNTIETISNIIKEEPKMNTIGTIGRQSTFENLGTKIVNSSTVEEALIEAGLNYEVHKRPVSDLKDDYTDVNAFKASLADTLVYYYLADPIEELLSEDAVEEYNKLYTRYNATNVITSDGRAYIEVEYVADTKKYIDSKIAEVQDLILNNISN